MSEPRLYVSEHACSVCGWRHQVDAFRPKTRVRVVSQPSTSDSYGIVGSAVDGYYGREGVVIEWGAYNGPVYVRVEFAKNDRENFSPCELEAV